jgi:hypothetical protein
MDGGMFSKRTSLAVSLWALSLVSNSIAILPIWNQSMISTVVLDMCIVATMAMHIRDFRSPYPISLPQLQLVIAVLPLRFAPSYTKFMAATSIVASNYAYLNPQTADDIIVTCLPLFTSSGLGIYAEVCLLSYWWYKKMKAAAAVIPLDLLD